MLPKRSSICFKWNAKSRKGAPMSSSNDEDSSTLSDLSFIALLLLAAVVVGSLAAFFTGIPLFGTHAETAKREALTEPAYCQVYSPAEGTTRVLRIDQVMIVMGETLKCPD